MKNEAQKTGVKIVTGDTKVVEKGSADKIFINTSGIGVASINLSLKWIRSGDEIIISGPIAEHGVTILSQQQKLDIKGNIKSDCAPLWGLVKEIVGFKNAVKFMRDPTRGGLATTLNEISKQSGLSLEIFEDKIPIKDEVRAVCELVGLDPLYLANEGKVIIVVDQK